MVAAPEISNQPTTFLRQLADIPSLIMHKFGKIFIGLLVLGLVTLIASWIVSEVRWRIVNAPSGKFETAEAYLAAGRPPRDVVAVEANQGEFWIAYGALDTWMATPSGSAAYVFDAEGILRDWTSDVGDDSGFQIRWTGKARPSSVDELGKLGK